MLVERNVEVPMRDGTVLRADVFRPESADGCPVMLLRLPYDKSILTEPGFPSEVKFFVPRGYICVVQDVRGMYASEGVFSPFRDEAPDTVDTIEWAAKIEGANGKVVMAGQSYLGSVQVQAAAERPSPLVAISPVSPLVDFADNGYRRGGAVESAFFFAWATRMAIQTAHRCGRDEEAAALAALIEDQPDHPFPPLSRSSAIHAPFDEILKHYDGVAPWIRQGLEEAGRPDAGQHLSTQQLVPKIAVPSLYVTSWYDMLLGGVLKAYSVGVSTGAAPTHLVIGPWEHAHYGAPQSIAGELDFGPAAEFELWPLLEQFFAPLAGIGHGDPVPGVQYFTMGINEWRSADVWPPESTAVRFFLHSAGGTVTGGPTGTLDTVAPTDEAADEWTHDPKNPVPSTGGQTWSIPNGPRDQSALLERVDVLAFDSEVLPSAVEVTGAVHAEVWLETDAASADIVAALVDVHPDGRRYPVTQGILRLGTELEPLHEKGSISFSVDLWATSHVFLEGHRISVQLAASDFPHWDVNPSDGKAWATSSEPKAGRHRLAHDAARPSMIALPIVGELPAIFDRSER
ncbi:CocE/NonD family hydrolase [Streptomyces coffeae]|uniref:CocE/NonD family hydrolase n=1 Tax=Streptomyces coffeae TaxID=621382 RepID=A0ABS1NE46_9ACTN|nr:CocE/NonD family hydrolase [Streptomyces coffeae]MBL1098323.1 CocE/NonD family hydrolase [Streptomyces coffeae]